MKQEYTASTINYPGCGYSSVNKYNNYTFQGPQYQAALQTSQQYYLVPDINPVLSYDTLVKGNSCNGYANISSAYGLGAEDCCPGYKKMCCNTQIPCSPCEPVKAAPCIPHQVQAAPRCVQTAAGPVIM